MAMRKGGELIAEFLVREKIPYVFGICGHGNVGLLDALYDVRDQVKLVSPRHEQTAGHMADGYFRVKHQPGGDADLDRAGLGEPGHGARGRSDRFLGAASPSPRTCRPRSSTAARSRSSTATTRPTSTA